jgi:hypothetical protein
MFSPAFFSKAAATPLTNTFDKFKLPIRLYGRGKNHLQKPFEITLV